MKEVLTDFIICWISGIKLNILYILFKNLSARSLCHHESNAPIPGNKRSSEATWLIKGLIGAHTCSAAVHSPAGAGPFLSGSLARC